MILEKNGITFNLTDTIQIEAFINSGWTVFYETIPEVAEPEKKGKQIKKNVEPEVGEAK